MIITSIRKTLAVLALCLLAHQSTVHAQMILGTGDQYVNVVIQADGFGPDPLWYQYHYNQADYSDPTDPLRGADILIALANDPGSGLSMTYSGTAEQSFFFTKLTYQSVTLESFLDDNSWTYFNAGGTVNQLNGFYEPIVDGDGVPVVDPVAVGSWTIGPVGASVRYLNSGDWDAWVFGPWVFDPDTFNVNYEGATPSIAPVPEPSTMAFLLVAALLAIVWFSYQRKLSRG